MCVNHHGTTQEVYNFNKSYILSYMIFYVIDPTMPEILQSSPADNKAYRVVSDFECYKFLDCLLNLHAETSSTCVALRRV